MSATRSSGAGHPLVYYPRMKLWMSPTSPYARKVRIVLREKNIACAEAAPADEAVDIGSKNPLAKIPTLELDDGTLLFDSVVIVEYLDALSSSNRLIPGGALDRAIVRRWEALADGIADAVVLGMLENRRSPERRDPGTIQRQHRKVRAALAAVEEQLERHGSLAGGTFSLADAAVIAAVGYTDLRAPDLLAPPHPALQAYLARHAERPSVAETRPPK